MDDFHVILSRNLAAAFLGASEKRFQMGRDCPIPQRVFRIPWAALIFVIGSRSNTEMIRSRHGRRDATRTPPAGPQTDLSYSEIKVESNSINDALLDGSAFGKAIAALHAADVAIFDVTNFEPGVMLLLGIRSVLRNGVTLITTLSKFDTDQWSRLPFNLKELYPLFIKPQDAIPLNFDWSGSHHGADVKL